MASMDSLNIRQAMKSGFVQQVGSDTPVAIRLRYKGTGTVTSVTTTTRTGIVMITSDGGTDSYEFGTYTTVGALVDKINADGIFEAKVLDTVRSEATDDQFVDGAISSSTFEGVTIWDVLVDTNTANYFATRLTWDRGFLKPHKVNHRVHLKHCVYYINLGTAAAAGFKIYKIDSDGTTETLIYSNTSVDSTATTEVDGDKNQYISGPEGGDLVVKVDDSGTLADASTNYLRIFGELE